MMIAGGAEAAVTRLTLRFEYIDASLSKDNYCELDIYQPIMENDRNDFS